MLPEKNKNISIFEVNDGAIIYNRITKRSHRIGPREYNVYSKLDGGTTNEQLSEMTGCSIDSIAEMIKVFEAAHLLVSSDLICDKQTKKKTRYYI